MVMLVIIGIIFSVYVLKEQFMQEGGTSTCFTPLPRADGKGGDLILRGGYPMAISLLSGKSYLTGRAKVIDLPS